MQRNVVDINESEFCELFDAKLVAASRVEDERCTIREDDLRILEHDDFHDRKRRRCRST